LHLFLLVAKDFGHATGEQFAIFVVSKSFNGQSNARDIVRPRALSGCFNADVGQAMLNVMNSILDVDAPALRAVTGFAAA
jgi:hypothetical protein